MIFKSFGLFAALLSGFFFYPNIQQAYAGLPGGGGDAGTYVQELSACRMAEQSRASILLSDPDQRRLELARSFTRHLEARGQDPAVIRALYRASVKSGVDFELLLLKAIMESDLGRATVAQESSARGVFQYIEPTWLTLINRYGSQIGYAHYAHAISLTKSGIPYIKGRNTYLKAEILALRHDPEASALIKAYQILEETEVIKAFKGGEAVTATDHYIAHMLGLSLAKEFYDLQKTGSILAVAGLGRADMREAAKLNRPFFYDGKKPLTASASYRRFERRVAKEMDNIRSVSNLKKQNCAQTRTAQR
ncbi:MAG: hypothetical protein KDJ75_04930 [Alphaproteobacteria bacterium]|nr:hypothetical protein [Alphaproteobacteria bacterium]